jgi:hypothetical protein
LMVSTERSPPGRQCEGKPWGCRHLLTNQGFTSMALPKTRLLCIWPVLRNVRSRQVHGARISSLKGDNALELRTKMPSRWTRTNPWEAAPAMQLTTTSTTNRMWLTSQSCK